MKKLAKKNGSDSGFILILALIMLSLLLFIGFVFVAESNLSHKTATAFSQSSLVDGFSRGVLSNISYNLQTVLEENDPGTYTPSVSEIGSSPVNNPEAHSIFHWLCLDPGSGTRKYSDMRVTLLTRDGKYTSDGKHCSPYLEFYLGEDGPGMISSPLYYAGFTETSGSSSNIRTPYFDGVDKDGDGSYDYRYTYMIMSQSGKIDPNRAVIDPADTSVEASEVNAFNRFYSRIDSAGNIDLNSLPQYDEVALAGAMDANFNSSIVSDIRNKKPTGVGWSSFAHLSQALNLTEGSSNIKDTADYLNYYGLYPHSIEEALPPIDVSQRYNLSLINNSSNFTSKIGPERDADGDGYNGTIYDAIHDAGIIDNSILGTTGNDINSNGIIDGFEAGLGMSSRSQLAANILDYCDTDLNARTDADLTKDYDSSDGSFEEPTYVGVERGPLISEVNIRFNIYPVIIGDLASGHNVEVDYDESYLEVIYPYGSISEIDSSVATVEFTYEKANGTWEKGSFECSLEFKQDTITTDRVLLLKPNPAKAGDTVFHNNTRSGTHGMRLKTNGLRVILDSSITDSTGNSESGRNDICVVNIERNQEYWQNQSGGTHYTFFNASGGWVRWNYQNRDPFAHSVTELNSKPLWSLNNGCTKSAYLWNFSTGGYKSPEADNTGYRGENLALLANENHDANYSDKENSYTSLLADHSSLFFRNGPPKSLVELGCIRTGNPWQTIDLLAEPSYSSGEYKGHYSLLNLFRLGDGRGQESSGFLKASSNVRLNSNSRFAHVLKAIFAGVATPIVNPLEAGSGAPESVGSSDAEVISEGKINTLVNFFPGVLTKDSDADDFSVKNDETLNSSSTPVYASSVLPLVEDCRSIFGAIAKHPDGSNILYKGKTVPDRNPVALRRPFVSAKASSSNNLTDHEAERLFWYSKDLMGGMNYFSIIFTVQPGTGNNPMSSFKPSAGNAIYRAELAYGLDSLEPSDRENKVMKIISIRKTK